jgi:hypothetical protein
MSAEDNSWRIMELRARFGAEPRNVPRHFQFSSARVSSSKNFWNVAHYRKSDGEARRRAIFPD